MIISNNGTTIDSTGTIIPTRISAKINVLPLNCTRDTAKAAHELNNTVIAVCTTPTMTLFQVQRHIIAVPSGFSTALKLSIENFVVNNSPSTVTVEPGCLKAAISIQRTGANMTTARV
ncbi:hypothetical protein D3C80_1646390 [compost metagenome]